MSEKIYKDYTEEDLKQYFKGSNFSLTTIEVMGRKKSITLTCKKGHKTTDKVSAALRRKVCYRCTSLTYKDNLDRRLAANDFKILDYTPDINTNSIVQVKCSKGHIRKGKLSLYIHNSGCRVCSGKEVEEGEVESKLRDKGYELIGDFTFIDRPYYLIHKECGKTFHLKTLINIHNNRASCPHCAGIIRKTDKEISIMLENNGWRITDTVLPDYTRSSVKLTCIECGLTREGILGNYLYKSISCPDCTGRFYENSKDDAKAVLYYLKIDFEGETYYKIGITYKDYSMRFKRDLKRDGINIQMLSQLQCDTRLKARKLEQYFLTTFSEYRYKGSPILLSGGNTELFTRDVLELDI